MLSPGGQFDLMQQQHGDVMSAFNQENRSRVVQSREEAARQHELEMAKIQNDAMIQRLKMEQEAAERRLYAEDQAQRAARFAAGMGGSRRRSSNGTTEYV